VSAWPDDTGKLSLLQAVVEGLARAQSQSRQGPRPLWACERIYRVCLTSLNEDCIGLDTPAWTMGGRLNRNSDWGGGMAPYIPRRVDSRSAVSGDGGAAPPHCDRGVPATTWSRSPRTRARGVCCSSLVVCLCRILSFNEQGWVRDSEVSASTAACAPSLFECVGGRYLVSCWGGPVCFSRSQRGSWQGATTQA